MDVTIAQGSLWALVVVPALVGGLLVLSSRAEGVQRVAPAVAVGGGALTVGLSVVVAVARPAVAVPFLAGSDLGLAIDGLAAVVAPTVAAVAALVLVGGAADVRSSRARFHGLMLLFTAAALLTVTATTLPTLLLAWEIMGATSWALIGFVWSDRRRVSSGLTAFVTTRAADLGLYVAAGAALAGGAGLRLEDLASAAPGWRDVVAAGVLVAALGKAAQLVLSFWLSRAMDGPSPVSALLHSAAMVAMGGYLLLRLVPLLDAVPWAATAAAWAGAVTAAALGLVAVAQRDLKQLLAASTSAQLGFVVLAAGVGAQAAGVAHLVAHAATKAALFLAAGAWLSALGTKALGGLRGAVAEWPLVRGAATVALLALAGVPPLSLWATKDLVLAAALAHSPALALVGVLGAVASAAYAGTVLRVIWAPLSREEAASADSHRGEEGRAEGSVPRGLAGAVVTLAAAAGLLGLVAVPAVAEWLADVVGSALVEPTTAEVVGSAVLAVVVVAVTWRRPISLGPVAGWAASWGGFEAGAHRVVVGPTVALARRLDAADRRLASGVVRAASGALRVAAWAATADDVVLRSRVDAVARGSRSAARAAAEVDVRRVHGAVLALAGAVRRAGAAARRPQTGQLHHYYVQAVATLALGIVLLVLVR